VTSPPRHRSVRLFRFGYTREKTCLGCGCGIGPERANILSIGACSGQRKRRPMRPGEQKNGTRQAYLARRRSSAGVGSDFFRHSLFWGLSAGWVGGEIICDMNKCTYPAAVILGAFFILSFSLQLRSPKPH
jgi:hypothetical protein